MSAVEDVYGRDWASTVAGWQYSSPCAPEFGETPSSTSFSDDCASANPTSVKSPLEARLTPHLLRSLCRITGVSPLASLDSVAESRGFRLGALYSFGMLRMLSSPDFPDQSADAVDYPLCLITSLASIFELMPSELVRIYVLQFSLHIAAASADAVSLLTLDALSIGCDSDFLADPLVATSFTLLRTQSLLARSYAWGPLLRLSAMPRPSDDPWKYCCMFARGVILGLLESYEERRDSWALHLASSACLDPPSRSSSPASSISPSHSVACASAPCTDVTLQGAEFMPMVLPYSLSPAAGSAPLRQADDSGSPLDEEF